jgi:hypothetical protein
MDKESESYAKHYFLLLVSETALQNLNTKMNLSFKGSFTRKSDFAFKLTS